jgi:hypothetical protein
MQERLDPLIAGLEWQKSAYQIHYGSILRHSVVESINKSHKDLVRLAVENDWDEICIAEDDLMFTHENSWQFFLANKPHYTQYDLYVASTFIMPHDPLHICGFHLYTVSKRFYDTFLSAPDKEHIDYVMNDIGGKFKVCYPFPALQRAGFSQNNSAYSDYNTKLRPEDIYNGQ